MKLTIGHDGLLRYRMNEFLDGVNDFDTFCERMEKHAETAGYGNTKDVNTAKGEMFEIFCEVLIKSNPLGFGFDRLVMTNDSTNCPYEYSLDLGVDFHGVGSDGKMATGQCKYRNAGYELTQNEDHLLNFVVSSWRQFKIPIEPGEPYQQNRIIITAAKNAHYSIEEGLMKGLCTFFVRKDIKKMVDNRPIFWDAFREAFNEGLAAVRNSIPTP